MVLIRFTIERKEGKGRKMSIADAIEWSMREKDKMFSMVRFVVVKFAKWPPTSVRGH